MLAGWVMLATVAGQVRADSSAPSTTAEVPAVKRQMVCPVMGGAINRSLFADYGGKRVYFCCGGCVARFKKDPAAIISKMESEGITLDKTPATP